ncbi:sigma-70 family RNA polymerase sigma factor [Actinoplanes sp. NPDC089786]|uniref:sigma-70 family RNA polymerase sigma factor n=1 Tax=Actinoplanes sp. NPDC089786 TaxID=3155185 RepID=UPI0034317B72
MPDQPDTATVVAARAGDPAAVDRLVAGYLPLVYTIVGRAMDGHADVDDVVQDVMLRVLRNLGDLRDPAAFRSWLVAITVRQIRERFRARRGTPDVLLPDDVRDPGADFTDLAITRLELSGQRRETAAATRWLDEDNRELLSLWWLEASGELTRDEIVEAIGVTRQHAAVRVQRMKGQLETARVVVRALDADPVCAELRVVLTGWDGHPSPLWRKRVARHTRDCRECSPAWSGLVAAERLLAGMALVPVPLAMKGAVIGGAQAGGHLALAGKIAFGMSRRVLTVVLSTTAVAGGGAAVVVYHQHEERPPARAAVIVPSTAPAPKISLPPSVAPTTPPPKKPTPKKKATKAVPVLKTEKKGAAVWKFAGSKGALEDVGASWYYTWGSNNNEIPGPAGVEFVPMIWDERNVTTSTLAEAKREGDGTLLGFNEPDMAGQADMTVEQALAKWPELAKTGMRLGAPAVAFGGDQDNGWLDRFMDGAEAKKLKVDFIPIHWYGSDFSAASVNQFLGYVDAVHQKYGKPIWITEYGLMNFTGSPKYPNTAQIVAFIKGSTTGLEKRSYVERYAWFGLPAVGDSVDFGLYRDASAPTEAGKAYRAAG